MSGPARRACIVFDCEFLTDAGAPQRFWCGPRDPDPLPVQIGALRLSLEPPFAELGQFEAVIAPRDRHGAPVAPSALFTRLTGLSAARVAAGQPLAQALEDFAAFAGAARIWSWGKDEFNLLAIGCYVAGIAPPIPADRFGNATVLLEAAGVPAEDIHTLRSPGLPAFFGLPEAGRAHDALGDARSVAAALRHLMTEGRLDPAAAA